MEALKQFWKDTKVCWGKCWLMGKIFVALTAPLFIWLYILVFLYEGIRGVELDGRIYPKKGIKKL